MISSLQLDITRKCQQECVHCYNSSGPEGDHGAMTVEDWEKVISEAAGLGIGRIQFIGGEPVLNRGLRSLMNAVTGLGMNAEIFTNMVCVPEWLWEVAAGNRGAVALATSWYSGDAAVHRAVTGRDTHRLVARNIARAARGGLPLRVGVIDLGSAGGQDVGEAVSALAGLGVPAGQVSTDRVRRIGRARPGGAGEAAELCGRCGVVTAAVLPDGSVAPCPMSWWLSAGDVRADSLASLAGQVAALAAGARPEGGCAPSCGPNCSPMSGCVPWMACKPNG